MRFQRLSAKPLDDMPDIPKHEVVVVPEIAVHVVTGDTCYPDENGFSSHSAEVTTADPDLVRELSHRAGGEPFVLRCAALDVIGRMTMQEKTKKGTRFVVSIDDLAFRKPETPRDVV